MRTRARGIGLSLCLIGLAAVWAGPAKAATYTYTGNDLSSFSNITVPCVPLAVGCGITNITAELVFAAPLAPSLAFGAIAPVSWLISDGLTTVTDTTPGFSFVFPLSLSTDVAGNIDAWLFDVFSLASAAGDPTEIRTRNYSGTVDDQTAYCQSFASGCTFNGIANVINSPGAWSLAVVPVPAGAWLLGPAIALLGWMRRRPVAVY